jgi:hypothetical protein
VEGTRGQRGCGEVLGTGAAGAWREEGLGLGSRSRWGWRESVWDGDEGQESSTGMESESAEGSRQGVITDDLIWGGTRKS